MRGIYFRAGGRTIARLISRVPRGISDRRDLGEEARVGFDSLLREPRISWVDLDADKAAAQPLRRHPNRAAPREAIQDNAVGDLP